jgi:hypothetical protein
MNFTGNPEYLQINAQLPVFNYPIVIFSDGMIAVAQDLQ